MINEMRAFVAFGELGSIQRVANRTLRTQPAVTRQIQRLEEKLGVVLLDRRARPARLTPDGVTALDRCRTLLVDYEGFLTSFSRGEPAGILRLGVAPAAGDKTLVQALSQVRRRFPKMVVQVFSGWNDDLRRRLREGQLDAAVTATVEAANGPPANNDLVVVAQAEAKMTDLTEVCWVLSPAPCEVRTWLKAQLAERGGTLEVTAEAQDPALQLMMVREGIGFGFVPRHIADANLAGVQILAPRGFRVRLVSRLERTASATRHAPVLAFIEGEALGGKLANLTGFRQ